MRMWKINPKLLCRKHLLGEHVEMHMFVGALLKNKSLQGYKNKNLVEVHNIRKRHNELAKEMIRRNFKHNSPLKKFKEFVFGFVDVDRNIKELSFRCKECSKLIKENII